MKINKMDIRLNEQLSLFEQPISSQYDEHDLYDALYDYIINTKSIEGLEIEIPPMDIECSYLDFSNNGRKYKGKGGIYFLLGKKVNFSTLEIQAICTIEFVKNVLVKMVVLRQIFCFFITIRTYRCFVKMMK